MFVWGRISYIIGVSHGVRPEVYCYDFVAIFVLREGVRCGWRPVGHVFSFPLSHFENER